MGTTTEVIRPEIEQKVILPFRKNHVTPRILMADAYTIGANKFQSDEAKEKSVYYVVFRRSLSKINPDLYTEGDDRMIFDGLQRIIDRLFYEPVTYKEIEEADAFLEFAKVTNKGLARYDYPRDLWVIIVKEFNGRPPIKIEAMPEGSVVYPGEPCIQVTSMAPGFGELAAWFESKLLQVWAPSERVTQDEHWFKQVKAMILEIDPTMNNEQANFFASISTTDFGDRAGICAQESEDLGYAHLLTFPGSDTFCGGYQAWMNSNKTPGICTSVNALAHRNVQAYEFEKDCYNTMYDRAKNDEILSKVADCYDYKFAVENYLLPLALKSKETGNGKVVVGRPDSDDPTECVMFLCRLAVKNGLYEEKEIAGKKWKFGTFLKFIEGDGMDFTTMKKIYMALMDEGFAFYSWGLFGVGGNLRNNLKRDDFSAKYALCAKGLNDTPVVKLSETIGKTTLPGPFKVLRSSEALANKKTIVFQNEPGESAMVVYFDGSNIWKPFGPGQDDNFLDIKNRIRIQFESMPKNLTTSHGAPASDAILECRKELIKKYAPNKDVNKY